MVRVPPKVTDGLLGTERSWGCFKTEKLVTVASPEVELEIKINHVDIDGLIGIAQETLGEVQVFSRKTYRNIYSPQIGEKNSQYKSSLVNQ